MASAETDPIVICTTFESWHVHEHWTAAGHWLEFRQYRLELSQAINFHKLPDDVLLVIGTSNTAAIGAASEDRRL